MFQKILKWGAVEGKRESSIREEKEEK